MTTDPTSEAAALRRSGALIAARLAKGSALVEPEHDEGVALPQLDKPCPNCTGEAGEAMHAQNRADWQAWDERVGLAFADWQSEADLETKIYPDEHAAWLATEEYRLLKQEQPETLAPAGCVECDWRSVVPTTAGRELLAFLRRQGVKS